MLLRLITLLLACLSPLLAAAQTSAPGTGSDLQLLSIDTLLSGQSSVAGSSAQVVPLWASDDGRLLAIVGLAQRPGAPTLPPSPAFGGLSDLRIIDATNLFSTGLRWRPGHGLRADIVVGLQAPESADAASFTMLGGCVVRPCAPGALQRAAVGGSLGAGWTSSDRSGLDISFGLSWLDAHQSDMPLMLHGGSGIGSGDIALLAGADGAPFRLASSKLLSARGSWQLDQGAMIDLTAGLGRSQVAPLWYGIPGASLEVNQASLGLGIANGPLRGKIVGHVISSEFPGLPGARRWSGLDLGVSWRTPWRGEVSVGAQNLWTLPLDAHPPSEADGAQARMPYVQYRQDL